jgi:alcohol dehydrogenase class IV
VVNVPFEFATAARIRFGVGTRHELAAAAASMGSRALVATGSAAHRAAPLLGALEAALKAAGVTVAPMTVAAEPTVGMIREGVARAREERCDVVIAIGGGSVLDAGKAVAALLAHAGDPLDYLEVVGRGQPLTQPSVPMIAVPTTAGTGSEVTRNAVLASPEHHVKASLRSATMLPRLAIVDPELTLGLPPAITASTGLDALTQLIEPYVSLRANPMTDLFCVEGMRCAAGSLQRAWNRPDDLEARTGMAWASLLGGLALANAGLGAVHGFAAPLGGMFPAPHGAACAAVLPFAMEVNIRALRQRAPASDALRRYAEVARILTGDPQAGPDDGFRWVAQLCVALQIPPLRAWGVDELAIPDLVERAARAGSMKGNPIALTPEELREIVARAI